MEHTVNAYLERLPTDRLEQFLQQYAYEEGKEDFSYIIPYMQAELDRRKVKPADCG